MSWYRDKYGYTYYSRAFWNKGIIQKNKSEETYEKGAEEYEGYEVGVG